MGKKLTCTQIYYSVKKFDVNGNVNGHAVIVFENGSDTFKIECSIENSHDFKLGDTKIIYMENDNETKQ